MLLCLASFVLMNESYSIVYMYHVFFTCSSVDEHVGYFHVLAIVNGAAINIQLILRYMYLFKLWFSLDIRPGMVLVDHMIALFVVLLRNLHTGLHNGCTNFHSSH